MIASNDHRPPYVHAAHREEGWVVRLSLSFLLMLVEVMSIAPSERRVRRRQLNVLRREIADRLPDCRKLWWESKGTTCLENRWMSPIAPQVAVLTDPGAGSRQIVHAGYQAETGTIKLRFRNGSERHIRSEVVT